MEDVDGISALKEMVTMAIEQCEDPDILDLIYKLLTFDNLVGRSRLWLRPIFIRSSGNNLHVRRYE